MPSSVGVAGCGELVECSLGGRVGGAVDDESQIRVAERIEDVETHGDRPDVRVVHRLVALRSYGDVPRLPVGGEFGTTGFEFLYQDYQVRIMRVVDPRCPQIGHSSANYAVTVAVKVNESIVEEAHSKYIAFSSCCAVEAEKENRHRVVPCQDVQAVVQDHGGQWTDIVEKMCKTLGDNRFNTAFELTMSGQRQEVVDLVVGQPQCPRQGLHYLGRRPNVTRLLQTNQIVHWYAEPIRPQCGRW